MNYILDFNNNWSWVFTSRYCLLIDSPLALATRILAIFSAPCRLQAIGRLLSLAAKIWLTWPSALQLTWGFFTAFSIPSQLCSTYLMVSIILFCRGCSSARFKASSRCARTFCLFNDLIPQYTGFLSSGA